MGSLATILTLAPTAVTLVVQGLAAAVCFWGWRETQLRGWRMLGAAAALRITGSLPHIWTLTLLRNGPLSAVARWYTILGIADWITTLFASLLFLGGLYILSAEVRRVRLERSSLYSP